jgi:hypothetical protein
MIIIVFCVIFLTFKLYSVITEINAKEIEENGKTNIALVTGVGRSISLKRRKNLFVDISYTVNGKTYTPTLEIDYSRFNFYAIGDTLIIKYSNENPNLFKVIENRNENAKKEAEQIIKLLKQGAQYNKK